MNKTERNAFANGSQSVETKARPSETRTDTAHLARPEPPGHRAAGSGFVALSRFAVSQMAGEVKQSFLQRPHRVDHAAGFVRMDVLSPCDAPNEIWLITYWKDEPSYQSWHRSHLYQESHRGIPKGLRLVPKSVSIRFFEHVAS